jgi:hypothetical protein
MDIETKLWIIITIVILITLRTIVDLVYSTNYNKYLKKDEEKMNKIYDEYMYVKSFFDVPIVLLSIFLLFNINFNLKIYLFLFFSILNIFIDHFFEYLNIPLDENATYFMEKYYTLCSDIIIVTIGIYIVYKIFIVSK